MRAANLLILAATALLVSPAAFAFAVAPDWLKAAAVLPTPASAEKAPAVVLLDETSVEVNAQGVATETHRVAIRILHDAGKSRASGSLGYNGKSDKILSLGAWLIRKAATIETKKKSDWFDREMASNDIPIQEMRSATISLSDVALTHDVFGYETSLRSPLLVAQMFFRFESDLPVLTERVQLDLPAGFAIEAKVFGPVAPVSSTAQDHRWVWSWLDRPYRPAESHEDPTARIDSEMLVRLMAPAGATGFSPRSFMNWAEVGDFQQSLAVGQCDSSPGLIAKAQSLVAAGMDNLAKIKTLGEFVQKLRYVHISKGLQFGHGYKPRKASEVFSSGYGDCKDKANLLVALLREAGLHAHLVSACAEKAWVVKPDFPSPGQFNHAIVAIEADDTIQLPAVVATEKMGRLLFFDPTDPHTQVGDLPWSIQGSLVHVQVPGNSALTPLPSFAAQDDYRWDRRLAIKLSPDGACTIQGHISATGQTGAVLRAQSEGASLPKDLEQLVSRQLNDKFRGAAVVEKKAEDDRASGRCALSFTCTQPNYLQWLPGQSAIAKLDILSRSVLPNFSEKDRLLPIYLPAIALNDEIVLSIPAGFRVDEIPAKTSLESPYGNCHLTYEMAGDSVILKRLVVLHQTTIPVAEYPKLRQFFSDLAKADRTSLLLKPKG